VHTNKNVSGSKQLKMMEHFVLTKFLWKLWFYNVLKFQFSTLKEN